MQDNLLELIETFLDYCEGDAGWTVRKYVINLKGLSHTWTSA